MHAIGSGGEPWLGRAAGNPLGVILPLEEFALVEETLRQRLPVPDTADKLAHMEQAADDALFMDDLRETMSAFDSPVLPDPHAG